MNHLLHNFLSIDHLLAWIKQCNICSSAKNYEPLCTLISHSLLEIFTQNHQICHFGITFIFLLNSHKNIACPTNMPNELKKKKKKKSRHVTVMKRSFSTLNKDIPMYKQNCISQKHVRVEHSQKWLRIELYKKCSTKVQKT